MENDRKKIESQDEPQDTPSFDEVVRKMLNTPPKPKKDQRQSGQGLTSKGKKSVQNRA